jgi:EmrB/QacA subfamily drug resistance transporter
VPSTPTASGLTGTVGRTPSSRLLFTTVSLALFMGAVDQTMVATALVAVSTDFGVSLNWAGWTLTVYSLGRIMMSPIIGPVGERLGQRGVFVAAVVVFTTASLGCCLASNMGTLIAFRAVQALGGAAFIPAATGLVADAMGGNRDRAIGLFSSIIPVGAIVGPIVGGYLVTYWSWRAAFLINVPAGLVVIALSLHVLPRGRVPKTRPIDVVGSLCLCGALFAGSLAITSAAEARTLARWVLVGGLGLAAVALGRCVMRRRHRPDSVVSSSQLVGDGLGPMNVINVVFGGVALGLSALIPLYAQTRYGFSALSSGTVLTARGAGMVVVAAVAAMSLRRTGYRVPMALGFTLTAAGLMATAVPPPLGVTPFVWLSLTGLLVGAGMGLAMPAANNASLRQDPLRVASATGLRTTLRQLGAMTSISLATAILVRSLDPGLAAAWIFAAYAVPLLLIVPLVRLVPDNRVGW